MVIADKVREWIKRGPGPVFGHSPTDVLQKAWGVSGGCDLSLGAFVDNLHLLGFRPEQLGQNWLLRLPSGVNK